MPSENSNDDLTHGGILLVDKPPGTTSFGVVDNVRRVLMDASDFTPEPVVNRRRRRLKCGHAGSLDPVATGLLVLMCGQGTRLSPFLMGLNKGYTTTLRFGVSTDTLDVAGKTTEVKPVTCTPEHVESLLPRFLGAQKQVPPAYSAIKWKGQPLYKRARRGEAMPPLEPRSIHIQRLEIMDSRWGDAVPEEGLCAPDGLLYEITLEIECSSGTYVRALARDLAVALGTAGYVQRLRRDRVGPFQLTEAIPPGDLLDAAKLRNACIPLSRALPHLPRLRLTEQEARCVRQGQQPEINWLNRLEPAADPVREEISHFVMIDPTGSLVAVGKFTSEGGWPRSAAVFTATSGKAWPCA